MAFDFAGAYNHVRGAKWVAPAILALSLGDLIWVHIPGIWHPDNSDYANLLALLSVEASAGMSFYQQMNAVWQKATEKFQCESETRDKQMASMQTAMLHMLESHTVLLKAIGGGDVAHAGAGAAADEGVGDA